MTEVQTRERSVDRPRVASPAGLSADSSRGLPGILDRIVAGKRAEAGRLRTLRRDLARAAAAAPPRPFMDPLRRSGRVRVRSTRDWIRRASRRNTRAAAHS